MEATDCERSRPAVRWWPGIILIVVITLTSAAAGSLATLAYIGERPVPTVAEPEPEPNAGPAVPSVVLTEDLAAFLRVFRLVSDEFVEEVDEQDLWRGAMAGLVRATDDPYSGYLAVSEYTELLERTSGTYEGVGMVLTEMNDAIVVISPFEGSPADLAGIRTGDEVIAVDGMSVEGIPLDVAVDFIRGPMGTNVTVTIERGDETFDVDLVREQITIPTVSSTLLEDGIGYLRISSFNKQTGGYLRSQLDRLEQEGMRGLILDLRSNPGGDFDACVAVANEFVPAGPIVELVERDGISTVEMADGEGVSYPIVVLVDDGSASASEILAGAIRDRGVGVLLGTTTFGKASVQTVYSVGNGDGLKLTTGKYYTPSGRAIDGVGLEPDILVEPGDDPEVDVELQAAIEYLKETITAR